MKKQKVKEKNPNPNPVYSSKKRVGRGKETGIEIRSWKLEKEKTNFPIHFPNQPPNLNTLNQILCFILILLLPTQLGKHFFFDFSFLSGVRVDYLAPTLYLTDILALLLFIFNIKSLIKSFTHKKILILLMILFVNILLSQNIFVSMYRYIKIIELIGIFSIFRRARLSSRMLLLSFLIGGVFELFLSLAQFINKHSIQGIFYIFGERSLTLSTPGIAKASLHGVEILRPYGTFSHPNSMAGFFLLIYFFILTSKKFVHFSIPRNVFLFFSTLLIFFSFSKIAIVVYLILNFIYFWKSSFKNKCRLCFFSRIFIIIIMSFVFIQAKTDPLSLAKRLTLLSNSFSLVKQHPLLGVGLGNYLIAQNQFPQGFPDFLNQPVHNIFLLWLNETGIVVTLTLCILFFKEIKSWLKNSSYIVIVVLLTGLFDHYWLTLQQNFLLIGVILAVL